MSRQQHSARARGADDVDVPAEDTYAMSVRGDVLDVAAAMLRAAVADGCPADVAVRYRRMAGALRAVAARWRIAPDDATAAGIDAAQARRPRDARGGAR